ncbi:MAG: DUF1761 domain-containing protein [Firmicutes bacterium]|nr:DUF1761 domain-containing protein [Bacillota bacterium]
MTYNIDWVLMLLGTAINMVIGSIWYSPVLFAKEWMDDINLVYEEEEIDIARMVKVYVFLIISLLFMGYLVGFLVMNLHIIDMRMGLSLVLILWIGSSLPVIIKRWGFEGKDIRICMINNVYNFICYLTLVMIYVRYGL